MDEFHVLALRPLWRWAVVPAKHSILMPGMPFYRESSARAFYAEVVRDCEGLHPALIRRSWRGTVEVVKE